MLNKLHFHHNQTKTPQYKQRTSKQQNHTHWILSHSRVSISCHTQYSPPATKKQTTKKSKLKTRTNKQQTQQFNQTNQNNPNIPKNKPAQLRSQIPSLRPRIQWPKNQTLNEHSAPQRTFSIHDHSHERFSQENTTVYVLPPHIFELPLSTLYLNSAFSLRKNEINNCKHSATNPTPINTNKTLIIHKNFHNSFNNN